nr:ABC transporter substrate-binding protein [uncultured Moraxella sp.]
MNKFAPLTVILVIMGGLGFFLSQNNNKPTNAHNHSEHNHDHSHDGHSHDDKQNLIVVTPWEITSEDPSKSGFLFQRLGIAETLVETDNQGKLTEGLAISWQSTDNGKTWEFKLRPNVKFHDNTDLTADTVVKSLNVALSKPTALKPANIDKITALDPLTVKFELKQPLNAFPAYLAHSTSIILANSAFDDKNNVVKLVGTGAYQATKIEPPQKIEQVAFDNYWGEKAKIKNITYLANSRSETRTLLAQSKPNYLVYTLDSASLKRLQADPNIQVHSQSLARTIQYKVNVKDPLFADVKVRELMSKAIDRQGIATSILNIQDGMAEQILPPVFADWQVKTISQKPDYSAIKQEFIKLGFTQDDKGMLSKDGKPFKFTLKTFSDRPELPLIATALQNQWQQVGIAVDVSVGNFSEIPASHQDGTLQMALYARNYGLIPDATGALAEDFAPQGSDWGVMNWQNADLTNALTQLNALPNNSPESQALKQKISQIIVDERPITPILYYQQNVATSKDLKGLTIDPLERNFRLNQLSW